LAQDHISSRGCSLVFSSFRDRTNTAVLFAMACVSSPGFRSALLLALVGHVSATLIAAGKASAAGRKLPPRMPTFASFIASYSRTYSHGSAEFEERRALYEKRVAEAEHHNGQSNRRWTAGVNDLLDRTDEEFARLRGWRGGASSKPGVAAAGGLVSTYPSLTLYQTANPQALPRNVSWLHLQTAREVMDQGECGSCWAVASATVLQAHSEIYFPRNPRTFSSQDLVSCVPNPENCGGTGGCEGATIEMAFEYVMKNGIAEASKVPYKAVTGKCVATHPALVQVGALRQNRQSMQPKIAESAGMLFGMRGWEKLPENKYLPLMRALVQMGPIGVSVAADMWMGYSHGIFDNCKKDAVIDHAVTLIGYGEEEDSKEKWWGIINSWGPSWGESGRIRLLRHDNDEVAQCGWDKQPELGTACKGGPKQVRVCGMCGILYDSAVPHFASNVTTAL